MNQKERDIRRKLRILKHSEETGHAAKTCRYFSVAMPKIECGQKLNWARRFIKQWLGGWSSFVYTKR